MQNKRSKASCLNSLQVRQDILICGLMPKDIRLIRKKDTGINQITANSNSKTRVCGIIYPIEQFNFFYISSLANFVLPAPDSSLSIFRL